MKNLALNILDSEFWYSHVQLPRTLAQEKRNQTYVQDMGYDLESFINFELEVVVPLHPID